MVLIIAITKFGPTMFAYLPVFCRFIFNVFLRIFFLVRHPAAGIAKRKQSAGSPSIYAAFDLCTFWQETIITETFS